MPNLLCLVATPTRELFSGEVSYIEVPGMEGNYGVMKGHEMFLSTNRPGMLTLWLDEAGNEKRQFAVYEGATQVFNDKVTVLARFGADVSTIDADAVRGKVARMKEVIADLEKTHGEEGDAYGAVLETSKSRLAWYETQLRVVGAA